MFGLNFPNPIGMAAGFDKDARVPGALLDAGLGFVEIGTLTPRAQSGNPSPRIFRSATDRAVINRLGFNNEGHDGGVGAVRANGRRGIIGVNIGANRDSPDRIGDYVRGIERLAPVASYFTVNISSPNTPGLRDLQAPDALSALLRRVQQARAALPKAPPLLVKLAPDLADNDLPEIVNVIAASGADGIVVSNTTLARDLRGSRFRQGDWRALGPAAVHALDAHARPRLSAHRGQAAADRRRGHRLQARRRLPRSRPALR